MVRLPQVCDHQRAANPGKQEQEQRGDVTTVFHPKAVVGLSEEEIACKPSRNHCGSSARESPSHRGENDRHQIAEPDQIRGKKRSHGEQRGGCHRDQKRRHAHHVRPSTNTRQLMFHLSSRRIGGLINHPAIGILCGSRRREINALGGTAASGAYSAVRSRRMAYAALFALISSFNHSVPV